MLCHDAVVTAGLCITHPLTVLSSRSGLSLCISLLANIDNHTL